MGSVRPKDTSNNSSFFFHFKISLFFVGGGYGECLDPLTTVNPFLGTKLLGFNIERGSAALKGSRSSRIEETSRKEKKVECGGTSIIARAARIS